jgi:hypothetical protein
MKCDKCIWAEKRTGTKTFYPFSACIIKQSIKDNILTAMESRMAALQDHIIRDFGGGLVGRNES